MQANLKAEHTGRNADRIGDETLSNKDKCVQHCRQVLVEVEECVEEGRGVSNSC